MQDKYLIIICEFLICIFLVYKKNPLRWLICIFYALVLIIQTSSIILTNNFLPAIALANIDYINTFSKDYKLIFAFILSFFSILFIAYIIRDKKNKFFSNVALIIFFILCFFNFSAIGSFIQNVKKVYIESVVRLDKKDENKVIKEVSKEKIVFDSNVSDYITPKKYNVIVLFVESFSKIASKKDLMPNIYNFELNSLDVINYYNHSATTYRGIKGQITSFYQLSSGLAFKPFFNLKSKTTSLVKILDANGYNTILQSCENNTTRFSQEFGRLGFKSIVGYNGIHKHLSKKFANQLSDSESFEVMLNTIKKAKEPFFYAMYSAGTHLGYPLESNGVAYKDGKNRVLNLYHNFDYYFGKFFNEFKKLDIAKNTILIVTADHAAVPDNDFKNAFRTDPKFPIDKIEFVIYNPDIKKGIFDAKNLNSLSLAPTICDILGIKNEKNKFLGNSIFDKFHKEENYINAFEKSQLFFKEKEIKKDKNNTQLFNRITNYQIFGG